MIYGSLLQNSLCFEWRNNQHNLSFVEQRFNYYAKRRRNRENKRSMVRNMSEYAEYLFQVSVMKCFTFSCYFNINYVPVMLEFENIGVDSLLAPKNLVSL